MLTNTGKSIYNGSSSVKQLFLNQRSRTVNRKHKSGLNIYGGSIDNTDDTSSKSSRRTSMQKSKSANEYLNFAEQNSTAISGGDDQYGGVKPDPRIREIVENQINTTPNIEQIRQELQQYGVPGVDNDIDFDTNNVLYGKNLPESVKNLIIRVIEYYNDHTDDTDIPRNDSMTSVNTPRRNIAKYLNKVLSSKGINYNKLMERFITDSNEHLLSYMLLAYHDQQTDLMLRTMYTFGRILPFDKPSDWYDNYRLNSYGNAWNMIMYKDYDTHDVFTIGRTSPNDIDKSINLPFEKCVRYLVGSLRAFMIAESLCPESPHKFDNKNVSLQSICRGLSYEQICDECYKRYPFFYGGAHGCDVFDIDCTLTIREIKDFTNRYPSAHVGYILNTKTYASREGEHWVALEFTKGSAKLICSQRSHYTCFHDGGRLSQSIDDNGFGKSYNTELIQTDDFNCGLYAALSLFGLIRFETIEKTVADLGVNMTNWGAEVGKTTTAELIRAKIAGILKKRQLWTGQ